MVATEPQEWIDEAEARLCAAGYRPVSTIFGYDAQPGLRALRRRNFRVQWLLTRLHTFVVLQECPSVTAAEIAMFKAAAVKWAKSVKGGWPSAFGSGVAVFPVAVTGRASPDAVAEARRLPDKHFAALAFPVLVETNTRTAHTYAGDIYWGFAYQGFLGSQQHAVMGDLEGPTMQLTTRRVSKRILAVITAVILMFLLPLTTILWIELWSTLLNR